MALLALLSPGPTHGFDLKRRYDEILGARRELAYGQVYSTLQRLERDGLADDVGIMPGETADRHVYAITSAGVTELHSWLAIPVKPDSRPAELFTKVVLALVAGLDARAVLANQRAVYLERMRELTRRRQTSDVIDRLAGDFEIAHLDADLKWIELAAARLTEAGR